VEIEGQRVDLLPALLELLEERQKAGNLRALLGRPGRARAVRAGDDRYVLVPPERLERLLRVLLELSGELPQCAPREFGGVQSAAIGKLDRALSGAHVEPKRAVLPAAVTRPRQRAHSRRNQSHRWRRR
jgi:hypothetical protein